MAEKFDKHILSNGMVLLGEQMPGVESVAFDFMLPAGSAVLPEGYCGAANVIEDWIFRGAGQRNSRQLSDALDGLGLHRGSSVDSSHLTIGAALESANLAKAIELYADIITKPALNEDQFIFSKALATDAVKGLADDPRRNVMLKLREQFYPQPLGRSTAGDLEQLGKLSPANTAELIRDHFNPGQIIFGVAGKYDFAAVVSQMEKLFGGLQKKEPITIEQGKAGEKYQHLQSEGAQVHIGMMTGAVTPTDPDYYNARLAVSILSGGMSSRLFTEVREKRGLCYAIGARYHALKEAAGIMCYAGTTPDKAQETYDVTLGEFRKLADGISEDELHRAKVGLKSSLVMQSESSSSRAGAIGRDLYIFDRVRSLDEIKASIDETSVESITNYLKKNRFEDFSVVTIGPKPIQI